VQQSLAEAGERRGTGVAALIDSDPSVPSAETTEIMFTENRSPVLFTSRVWPTGDLVAPVR